MEKLKSKIPNILRKTPVLLRKTPILKKYLPMPSPKAIKLALVDDHKLFRESVAALVTPKFNVVFQAENGQDFIEKIGNSTTPDIILLDINMPGMDGLEALKWIKQNMLNIKIIMLTMYDSEEMIIKSIKLGANGFMLKTISSDELLTGIESVYNNDYYFDKIITDKIISFIKKVELPKEPVESLPNPFLQLNKRELEIVNLISKGLTDVEISNRLLLSRKTIEYSRYKIMEKLQVKNRTELVMLVATKRI